MYFLVVAQGNETSEEKNCDGPLDFNGNGVNCQCGCPVCYPINSPRGDGAVKEEISGLHAYGISTSSNCEVILHALLLLLLLLLY